MAEIVGVFCASHSPGLTGFPERATDEQRESVRVAFAEVATQLSVAQPDVIVAISVEHFTNFFLSNLPAFAIGTADRYRGPATPQMAQFLNIGQRDYPGHAAFGEHLYRHALANDFDPAGVAGGFMFDENFCVPLELIGPPAGIPLVPIIVNGINPPYPTLARCYDFGRMISAAVDSYEPSVRVAVVATGGLSHYVGMPQAGRIDVEFDREFLRRLCSGSSDSVTDYSDEDIDRAGNGAHEIRTWVIAAGAAAAPFRVLTYQPVPAWLTGTALAAGILPARDGRSQ